MLAAVRHFIVETHIQIAAIVGAHLMIVALEIGNATIGKHFVLTCSVDAAITGARILIVAVGVARAALSVALAWLGSRGGGGATGGGTSGASSASGATSAADASTSAASSASGASGATATSASGASSTANSSTSGASSASVVTKIESRPVSSSRANQNTAKNCENHKSRCPFSGNHFFVPFEGALELPPLYVCAEKRGQLADEGGFAIFLHLKCHEFYIDMPIEKIPRVATKNQQIVFFSRGQGGTRQKRRIHISSYNKNGIVNRRFHKSLSTATSSTSKIRLWRGCVENVARRFAQC
jgi:hypothetical protein